MRWRDLSSDIKNYLFPIFCLGCNQEGKWICTSCFEKLDLAGVYCCPICHRTTPGGVCCDDCRPQSFLRAEVALSPYEEGSVVGKLIYTLKYQYAEDVLSTFSRLLSFFLTTPPSWLGRMDTIVPVPLHAKRQAERGFNQSVLLADLLGALLSLPVSHILIRSRATGQQAKLNKEERQSNVSGAFALLPGVAVAGQRFLLVDDIYTTGSTMQECAGVLAGAGASYVAGFTIARG